MDARFTERNIELCLCVVCVVCTICLRNAGFPCISEIRNKISVVSYSCSGPEHITGL